VLVIPQHFRQNPRRATHQLPDLGLKSDFAGFPRISNYAASKQLMPTRHPHCILKPTASTSCQRDDEQRQKQMRLLWQTSIHERSRTAGEPIYTAAAQQFDYGSGMWQL
jgi:hypothetical protein